MRRWQFWLGVLISAAFLYPVVRGLHLDQVWYYLRHARYVWILPGVLVYFVGVWLRTWRWYYMLRPIKRIPLRHLFPVVCIGYFGNNVYPARAGEVLRAYVLKRKAGVPIVPVGLRGTERVLRARGIRVHGGRSIEVRVGVPIPPEEHVQAPMEVLVARVRREIGTLSGKET